MEENALSVKHHPNKGLKYLCLCHAVCGNVFRKLLLKNELS